jgi:hypothetical protein
MARAKAIAKAPAKASTKPSARRRGPEGKRRTARKVVASRGNSKVKAKVKTRPQRPTLPERDVHVKTLDPLVVCGPHTSVKHLFRVRERIDGVRTNHLVFFDKHGWYCEHGRGCHAVTIVRQANPRISD